MVQFRQKIFSEYDAMRSLYVELMKNGGDRNKWKIIDRSSLIPILKGNNVVIERFVISTSFLHRDRYRLYLKIGAKAKLPDEVRLPERVYDKTLGDTSLKINVGLFGGKIDEGGAGGSQPKESRKSDTLPEVTYKTRLFTNKKGGGNPPPTVSLSPQISFQYKVRELLGEAIKYDKKERSLVLEFKSIRDAISALNILPFGINYNIYLLE